MVKRTLVVLGILSMIVVGASVASAFNLGGPAAPTSWVSPFAGACGNDCPPMYCPVDCPPYPESKTIVKTWSCKIEGPAPACGPAMCGTGCGEKSGSLLGSLCYLLTSVATPFDFLFGGCDGVYGCCPGGGILGGCDGPCGPCYGPVPGAIHGVLSLVSPPPVMFGCYW